MAEQKFFEVVKGPLNIRETANGNPTKYTLDAGIQVEVVADSRREVNGYVWWQHSRGWSAERDVASTVIFMNEIHPSDMSAVVTLPQANTDTTSQLATALNNQAVAAQEEAEPERTANDGAASDLIPKGVSGETPFKVLQTVRVRSEPSTAAHVQQVGVLSPGAIITCDVDTLTKAENYYWLQHETGWSAWQSLDGSNVFMEITDEQPASTLAPGARPTDVTQLPNYQSLIARLPVNLSDTQWFQYFGNNVFAYVNGAAYGYDAFSQGLHAGLDFGNSNRTGIPVFAGVTGTFYKVETDNPHNFRVWVKSGDYLIIYQHVTNIRTFMRGNPITPDTVLAEIEGHDAGGFDHLHFEIRYQSKWIINPLVLMPETMVNQITSKYNPQRPNTNFKSTPSIYEYFYQAGAWTQWGTPLDQPVLELTGPVIGPRA